LPHTVGRGEELAWAPLYRTPDMAGIRGSHPRGDHFCDIRNRRGPPRWQQRGSLRLAAGHSAEFSEFRGRVGLNSTSDPNRARVQVLADGKAVFNDTVTLNRSHDVFIKNMSNVIRLQIKVFVPVEPEMVFGVGDPVLYRQ
jgi:hypothetical protein